MRVIRELKKKEKGMKAVPRQGHNVFFFLSSSFFFLPISFTFVIILLFFPPFFFTLSSRI